MFDLVTLAQSDLASLFDPASLFDLVPLAAMLIVGTFIQSASGFAAGLLIMSILVWFDYPIPVAQTALLVATIPQNGWGVWSFRDSIRPRELFWPAVGRIGFLPIGIFVLSMMQDHLSPARIKQVVGGLMLAITLAIIAFQVRPRERLHPAWAWLTFPLSGILQGLVGMGGPAMALWVQAHDWDTRRSRGFLFAMYLASLFPAMALIQWRFGSQFGKEAVVAALLSPAFLWITAVGLRAGSRLGRQRLRRLTLAMIIGVGLLSLAAPLLD